MRWSPARTQNTTDPGKKAISRLGSNKSARSLTILQHQLLKNVSKDPSLSDWRRFLNDIISILISFYAKSYFCKRIIANCVDYLRIKESSIGDIQEVGYKKIYRDFSVLFVGLDYVYFINIRVVSNSYKKVLFAKISIYVLFNLSATWTLNASYYANCGLLRIRF